MYVVYTKLLKAFNMVFIFKLYLKKNIFVGFSKYYTNVDWVEITQKVDLFLWWQLLQNKTMFIYIHQYNIFTNSGIKIYIANEMIINYNIYYFLYWPTTL